MLIYSDNISKYSDGEQEGLKYRILDIHPWTQKIVTG